MKKLKRTSRFTSLENIKNMEDQEVDAGKQVSNWGLLSLTMCISENQNHLMKIIKKH